MENTLKKELAKGVEDGKIDKEELNKLAFAVKENVLNQLGEDTVMILNNGKEIDFYEFDEIESYEKELLELLKKKGVSIDK